MGGSAERLSVILWLSAYCNEISLKIWCEGQVLEVHGVEECLHESWDQQNLRHREMIQESSLRRLGLRYAVFNELTVSHFFNIYIYY